MSSPRRIAFGITELDPGGAERMLTELVTRLDRCEWEPRVYCLGPDAHFAKILRDHQIPVTCFGGRGMWSSPKVLWQWSRELGRFRPDILYTWLFHANLLGRVAGLWARVPHLICGNRVAEKRTHWYGRLDRWTNSLVERNVCVSRGVADFIEQTVKLPKSKTVIIPNAVDQSRFENIPPADLSPIGIPPGSLVLTTIGRLERQKGIDVLLAASPQVLSRFPEAHLLIVGDGPERYLLEELARSFGIQSRVHWVNRRDDVPALLAASTALVLPSRWEGMPNVVLEAMAAGKPVVATQVEGVAELISAGVNGWLVPPEDPLLLGAALAECLTDGGVRMRMGLFSQTLIKNKFTLDSLVSNHVDLFRTILSSSR